MRLSALLTHALFALLFLSLGATLGLALYLLGADPIQAAVMAAAVWISEPFVVYVSKKWEERVYALVILIGALLKVMLPVWLPKAGMTVKSAQMVAIWTALVFTLIGIFGAAPLTRQFKRWLNVG